MPPDYSIPYVSCLQSQWHAKPCIPTLVILKHQCKTYGSKTCVCWWHGEVNRTTGKTLVVPLYVLLFYGTCKAMFLSRPLRPYIIQQSLLFQGDDPPVCNLLHQRAAEAAHRLRRRHARPCQVSGRCQCQADRRQAAAAATAHNPSRRKIRQTSPTADKKSVRRQRTAPKKAASARAGVSDHRRYGGQQGDWTAPCCPAPQVDRLQRFRPDGRSGGGLCWPPAGGPPDDRLHAVPVLVILLVVAVLLLHGVLFCAQRDGLYDDGVNAD